MRDRILKRPWARPEQNFVSVQLQVRENKSFYIFLKWRFAVPFPFYALNFRCFALGQTLVLCRQGGRKLWPKVRSILDRYILYRFSSCFQHYFVLLMGCQNLLHLCPPIFPSYFWQSRWAVWSRSRTWIGLYSILIKLSTRGKREHWECL